MQGAPSLECVRQENFQDGAVEISRATWVAIRPIRSSLRDEILCKGHRSNRWIYSQHPPGFEEFPRAVWRIWRGKINRVVDDGIKHLFTVFSMTMFSNFLWFVAPSIVYVLCYLQLITCHRSAFVWICDVCSVGKRWCEALNLFCLLELIEILTSLVGSVSGMATPQAVSVKVWV